VTNPLAPGSLDGRVAVVTGSSRGIGADTARYLAGAGAAVVVNYRSKAPRAEKVVAEITAAGGSAIAVGADLTDAASVAEMFERTVAELGPIDILVLNASGGMESGMGEDYAMRLNRDAQVNVVEGALPHFAEGARIVAHVGVGEENPVAVGGASPLPQRVCLPEPAGRRLVTPNEGDPGVSPGDRFDDLRGSVFRTVVDHDHAEVRVILREVRSDRPLDLRRLVARRNDDRDPRFDGRSPACPHAGEPRERPEIHGQGDGAQEGQDDARDQERVDHAPSLVIPSPSLCSGQAPRVI